MKKETKIVELNLRCLNSHQFREIMKKINNIRGVMGFKNKEDDSIIWVDMILDCIKSNWKEFDTGSFKVKINENSITFIPNFSMRLNFHEQDIKDINVFRKEKKQLETK